jgi:hypothetical protein
MPLVECLFDEEDAGAAGCSKDKKLHDISLSAGRPWRPIRQDQMPLPACICEPRAWLDESSSYDCDDFLPAPGPPLMSINPRRAGTL